MAMGLKSEDTPQSLWFRQNWEDLARRYPGLWVAVDDKGFIASARNMTSLRETLTDLNVTHEQLLITVMPGIPTREDLTETPEQDITPNAPDNGDAPFQKS